MIDKVRSRVSNILPSSISSWFSSPSGKNGNLRRRRDDSETEDPEFDASAVHEGGAAGGRNGGSEIFGIPPLAVNVNRLEGKPPSKRAKIDGIAGKVCVPEDVIYIYMFYYYYFFKNRLNTMVPEKPRSPIRRQWPARASSVDATGICAIPRWKRHTTFPKVSPPSVANNGTTTTMTMSPLIWEREARTIIERNISPNI